MRSRLSTRTATVRLTAASLAAAGAIFGGLAVQMAHGHDPALGAGTPTTHSSPRPQAETSAPSVITRAS
jgi:hypothetical protein